MAHDCVAAAQLPFSTTTPIPATPGERHNDRQGEHVGIPPRRETHLSPLGMSGIEVASAYCALAAVIGSSAPEQLEPLVWLQLFVAASITIGTSPVRTSKITHPAPVPFARLQVASL